MDQSKAPLLDALAAYHRSERYGFSPPGHRQGRGTDERALAILGKDPFRDDVLASGGLDDRMSRGGFLSKAEALMADAVGADGVLLDMWQLVVGQGRHDGGRWRNEGRPARRS
jgi:arginine decarboxylase